jgi:hypothetical protein
MNFEDNIVSLILNYGNLEHILSYVFSRLRDRPFELLRMYNIIGEEWLKTKDPKLEYFLSAVFNHKLWFLSIIDSFPQEIAFAYEYDFYVKNPVDYNPGDPVSVKTIIGKICDVLGINYTVLSTKKLDNIRYIDNNLQNKGALNFYLNQSRYLESKNEWKYIGSSVKMEDYFRPVYQKSINNVFLCENYQWFGFHVKMRRIFYILMITILPIIIKNYHDNMEMVSEFPNDKVKYEKVFKANVLSLNHYIIEIQSYASNNHYDSSIYDSSRKSNYFNLFDSYFNQCDSEFLKLPVREDLVALNMRIKNTYDNNVKYVLRDNDLIINIINIVENDVNFDDNVLIKLKFKDTEYADRLEINTNEFKWFYSELKDDKIVPLEKSTINDVNDELSIYWRYLLEYKLSKIKEPERKKQFGNYLF